MTAHPQLVSPEWLSEHVEDDSLRIVDATVILRLDPEGGDATVESGFAAWSEGHLPRACFADLMQLSDAEAGLPFMLPSPEAFADDASRLGIGPGTHVVVYDAREGMWATRLWWMLRVFGFDAVSVLDGGLTAWLAGDRPVSTDSPSYPSARFEAHFRPELVAGREQVEAHMGEGTGCLVNALPPGVFRGEVPIAHRRAGRIPGSVNVPTNALLDPQTNRFLPVERLREQFDRVGALDSDRPVITYCGGGIAATMDAFALSLLGRDDVAVYDGSLVEWAADPNRPLEIG